MLRIPSEWKTIKSKLFWCRLFYHIRHQSKELRHQLKAALYTEDDSILKTACEKFVEVSGRCVSKMDQNGTIRLLKFLVFRTVQQLNDNRWELLS
ncbi:hypothetical protein CEXT_779121 [Caerostris extrusa]|uniref:Uncharacterized protein n=1 Tax=Caerostris extrusa TaxID=172846 RepID=A0AAV4SN47_CAEEX|nr:hypothetical protein CEXT_779121 [Caerostris extrusa]